MGEVVGELENVLDGMEEEGGLILKEGFMMLVFQGIIDELPPFERYWTHMFQNKSMFSVGEFQSNSLTFSRLRKEILSPEDDTNKYTSAMLVYMAVTAAKALLAKMWYLKIHVGAFVK